MNGLRPSTLMIASSALLLAVILALVGAELPPETPFWQALPIWLVIVAAAVALLSALDVLLREVLDDLALPSVTKFLLIGAVAILIAALPVALMCLPIDGLMPDRDVLVSTSDDSATIAGLLWAWADQYLNLLPATACVWLMITAVRRLMPEPTVGDVCEETVPQDQGDRQEATPIQPEPHADLARRHPDIAREGLLAIEADEHYVRFHTPGASRHMLYRFRDALRDVEGLPGLQVHRSWWVAAEAIEGTERTGSTLGLKLRGGLTVPVSQTYRRDVEKLMDRRERQAS